MHEKSVKNFHQLLLNFIFFVPFEHENSTFNKSYFVAVSSWMVYTYTYTYLKWKKITVEHFPIISNLRQPKASSTGAKTKKHANKRKIIDDNKFSNPQIKFSFFSFCAVSSFCHSVLTTQRQLRHTKSKKRTQI